MSITFISLCVFEEGLQDATARQLRKRKEKTGNQDSQEKKAEQTQSLKHPQGTAFMLSLRDPDTPKSRDGGGEHTLLYKTHALYLWSEEIYGNLIDCFFIFIDILELYLCW